MLKWRFCVIKRGNVKIIGAESGQVIARGWGHGISGEVGKRGHIFSDKMNKVWGPNAKHGYYRWFHSTVSLDLLRE